MYGIPLRAPHCNFSSPDAKPFDDVDRFARGGSTRRTQNFLATARRSAASSIS